MKTKLKRKEDNATALYKNIWYFTVYSEKL